MFWINWSKILFRFLSYLKLLKFNNSVRFRYFLEIVFALFETVFFSRLLSLNVIVVVFSFVRFFKMFDKIWMRFFDWSWKKVFIKDFLLIVSLVLFIILRVFLIRFGLGIVESFFFLFVFILCEGGIIFLKFGCKLFVRFFFFFLRIWRI